MLHLNCVERLGEIIFVETLAGFPLLCRRKTLHLHYQRNGHLLAKPAIREKSVATFVYMKAPQNVARIVETLEQTACKPMWLGQEARTLTITMKTAFEEAEACRFWKP